MDRNRRSQPSAGAISRVMDTPTTASAKTTPDEPSFARSLFFGDIREELVFPYPEVLSEDARETLELLVEPVRKFMETRVDSAAIDEQCKIPDDVLEELKALGLFGLQIPEELGGLGLSNTAYARVFEVVAAYNASVAVTLGGHQSIGLKGILLFGTDEQKQKYLPRLATGEWVAAFALTEPSSGSDAASIRSRAELSEDGKHWILNGGKIWITNGGFADVFTVFAQTAVEHDGKLQDRVTAFIVERGFEGVSTGAEEHKLGIKGSSTTAVYFEDVRVPVENVIGEVGGGFKVAMTILNNGRFGLAAGAIGGMKRVIEAAAAHASQRKQFDRHLKDFELIQEKFAHMAMLVYAAESMTYMTCGLMDSGVADYALEAAMCKVFASEANWTVVNETMQVMGGAGYMKEYPFERFLRDSRIMMIFEGTNEILRLFIALSGIQGPGEHLRELVQAIRDPLQNYGMLLTEIVDRVRDRFRREHIERGHARLKRSAVQVEEQTVAFGQAVETMIRKHGKNIIDQQMLLERVANVAIDLYAMVAVLSRATRSLERERPGADHETVLCTRFCDAANRRIRRNLRAIEQARQNGDEELRKIATDLFAHGGCIPLHPLESRQS